MSGSLQGDPERSTAAALPTGTTIKNFLST